MSLPGWYIDCAEDYLSMLRNCQYYSHTELLEASKKQRIAEYKLMKLKLSECEVRPVGCEVGQEGEDGQVTNKQIHIKPYENNAMYQGYFNSCTQKKTIQKKSDFWESILKT